MPGEDGGCEVAFVLGGGGVLGAHEVGMLRALAETGIEPDLVLGTSVGAINGAFFAAEPSADGVLASCAVPGVLPPVRIDGEHFIDGGIVNSIPVARAVALGARSIYVLQVGRLEKPLSPPRWPWEVGLVAFEVARRHRFAYDLQSLPEDVEIHVMPTGGSAAPAYNDVAAQLRLKRAVRTVSEQIETAYEASLRYLDES